jgi:hypothetical protein
MARDLYRFRNGVTSAGLREVRYQDDCLATSNTPACSQNYLVLV